VRRVFLCPLIIGCSFEPGTSSGDASSRSDAANAAPHTRLIDIADRLVIGGPHADFPMLVSLSAPWLRSSSLGGDIASAAGFDITFSSDRAGAQRLAHELEAYRSSAGELIAWVKLPELVPSTTLYIHYGDTTISTSQENAAAVWSAGYAAVWHLAGDLRDSTGISPGKNSGSKDTTGRIERARQFDGCDDAVTFGSAATIDNVFATGGTAETWIRPTTWGGASRGRLFEKSDASSGSGMGWGISVDNHNVSAAVMFGYGGTTSDGLWNSPPDSIPLDAWTHVAVVYDVTNAPTHPLIYLNGHEVAISVLQPLNGAVSFDDAYDLMIGTRFAADRTFDGVLDEMRLSTVPRTQSWLETAYRNQIDASAFYTVGEPL